MGRKPGLAQAAQVAPRPPSPQSRTLFSEAVQLREGSLHPSSSCVFQGRPQSPAPRRGLQGWWFLSSYCQSDRSLGQQPRQAGAHVLEGRRGFLARVPGPRSLHPTFTGSFAKSPLEIPSHRPACQTRTWPLGENGNSGGRGDPRRCAQITTHTPPSGALTVSRAGSERHRRWAGEGRPGAGTGFHRPGCRPRALPPGAASAFAFLLSQVLEHTQRPRQAMRC